MADSPSLIKPAKMNGRKSCSNFNILSPQLKEPFEKGWKREVVYRAIVSNARRNMCDIYYFAPDGTKFRSGREISDYLNQTKSSFSMENFTFCKEPIGMDVKYEVLRFARAVARRNVGASRNASPKKTLSVQANRETQLQHGERKDDTKGATSKLNTQVIDSENTTSKLNDTKRLKARDSARKALPKKRKLRAKPRTRKAKLTQSLHSSSCKSDGDLTSTLSDNEQLKSPSDSPNLCEKNVESPEQKSPASIVELPETLPETLPLTSPLIALLPLGTTLILSDSQTVRIIPSNPNSTSIPVKGSEAITPKVSSPPAVNILPSVTEVTDLSSATSLSLDAVTSLNRVEVKENGKSVPCSTLFRRILPPQTDEYTVPSCASAYKDQVPRALFGTENRIRSYWANIGQTIIEEGLNRAKLSHACQVNPPVKKNPVGMKRKQRVPVKYRDAVRSSSPTTSVLPTCKEYFAFRKERRQQQLNSQSSATASTSTSN